MSRTIITLIAAISLLSSCAPQADVEAETPDPAVLIKADSAFSAMSVEAGMKAAFLHYADSQAVMLRDKGMPVVGIEAVAERLKGIDDSLFTFRWEPMYAAIAGSGDLGYTYGVWHVETLDSAMSAGTYVSVWKLQPDGQWKWVIDVGTEGIEPDESWELRTQNSDGS